MSLAAGDFDRTLSLNGIYQLRLVATDMSGRVAMTPEDAPAINVRGNFKVGQFTLSFHVVGRIDIVERGGIEVVGNPGGGRADVAKVARRGRMGGRWSPRGTSRRRDRIEVVKLGCAQCREIPGNFATALTSQNEGETEHAAIAWDRSG